MDISSTAVALLSGLILGVASYDTIKFTGKNRGTKDSPNNIVRYERTSFTGMAGTPIDSQWLHRNHEMDQRQLVRDETQRAIARIR